MLYLELYDYDIERLLFVDSIKDIYGLLSRKLSFQKLIMLDIKCLGRYRIHKYFFWMK